MGLLKRFLSTMFSQDPNLDWAQIEVTTRCNARCVYCPRTQAGDAWRDMDMDFGLFARIVPQLSRTDHVHLQSWGEPLLHPRFFDMVRLAAEHGLSTGATSNGVLIDAAVAEEIVRSGLGILGLSLAGTGPGHDAARPGAPLARALAAMREVTAAKARLRSATPALHVAYMLLRGAEDELDGLPDLLEGAGVAAVVVNTLDHVADPSLMDSAFSDPVEAARVRPRLDDLAARLHARGTLLHYRLPRPSPAAICPENPCRALVVDAAGGVSPCVYAAVPIAPPHPAASRRLSFGNAAELPLSVIWERSPQAAFRAAWEAGAPPERCLSCRKRFVA